MTKQHEKSISIEDVPEVRSKQNDQLQQLIASTKIRLSQRNQHRVSPALTQGTEDHQEDQR